MKIVINSIKITFLLALFLVTSCTIEKRVHRKGYHITSNISLKKKSSDKKEIIKEKVNRSLIGSNKKENSSILIIEPDTNSVELIQNESKAIVKNEMKNQSADKKLITNKKPNQKIKIVKDSPMNKPNSKIKNTPKRKTAKITGWSLLLMAVLSGISIPVLGTLTASIGLIGIFILDILVSFGILKYYKKEKPKLAKVSSILRLLYTAILGIAIGHHIAGSVSMFNHVWGIGLIVFGIHLITLGIMFNNESGKKWVNYLIKGLLIFAGLGYIILNVGILIVPNPVGFTAMIEPIFIIPMVLGEVLFALWMLIRGGKTDKK
jgi:hypothetical protein